MTRASGTEEVAPPKGGHLSLTSSAAGSRPPAWTPRPRPAPQADNISPAPSKGMGGRIQSAIGGSGLSRRLHGHPPVYSWKTERRHHGRKAQAASASPGDGCRRSAQAPLCKRRPRITPTLIWDDDQFELRHPGEFDVVVFDPSNRARSAEIPLLAYDFLERSSTIR